MLGLIKTLMTLGGRFAGYKTYVAAASVFFITLGTWLGADVVPWLNGDFGLVELITRSGEDFTLMFGAFAATGLRKSNEE